MHRVKIIILKSGIISFASTCSKMAHMHMSPVTRVTPKTVTQRNITVQSRWSIDPPRTFDANLPSDPKVITDDIYEKVITYDIYEEKSAEQLLNEVYK